MKSHRTILRSTTWFIVVLTFAIFLMLGPSANATTVTVTSNYTITGGGTDTAQTIATIDTAGLTGVGIEQVGLSGLTAFFSNRGGTPFSPQDISLSQPDLLGNFQHGAFTAVFDNGVFDFLTSVNLGFGTSAAPARMLPNAGIVKRFVFLGQSSVSEVIEFAGSVGYNLVSQSVSVTAVPLPPALPLFAVALAAVFLARRCRPRGA